MNRKKKTEKIAAEALLIVILTITVLLIVATGCYSECTHVPKNNTTEEWNNHVDSVLKNKIKEEYHGKEGKSEYGEYTPSDEYKMCVGENGDTIWE